MTHNNTTNTDLAYADTLWKSADALRGQVDAAEYKHVVLGLLFLKYISDSFEARREELKAELEAEGITGKQLEALLENRDEYTAERVFWVPPEARWPNLQNQATRPDIATLIDDAILAVERDNPNLKSKLPRDYARRGIEPVKLKGLIDLVADVGFKRGASATGETPVALRAPSVSPVAVLGDAAPSGHQLHRPSSSPPSSNFREDRVSSYVGTEGRMSNVEGEGQRLAWRARSYSTRRQTAGQR
jgi:hypothetical protein